MPSHGGFLEDIMLTENLYGYVAGEMCTSQIELRNSVVDINWMTIFYLQLSTAGHDW